MTCRTEKSTVPDKALIDIISMSRVQIAVLYRAGHKLSKGKAVEREAHDDSAWWGTSYRWVDRGRIQRIGSMTDTKSPRRC